MNKPKQITESDLQPQERPGDGWYIIEAAGSYENVTTGGTRVVQELSAETLAAIAEAGVPAEGLPIDKDHLSLDHANSTEAMGWVRELAMCGDALAARIEWTALGLPLIQGKVYKHFSTVYPVPRSFGLSRRSNAETEGEPPRQSGIGSHDAAEAGISFTPTRLSGLALTNQPNNDGQPAILNLANAGLNPDQISADAARAADALENAIAESSREDADETAQNGCTKRGCTKHPDNGVGASIHAQKGDRASGGKPWAKRNQTNTPLKAAPGAKLQAQVRRSHQAPDAAFLDPAI